jgi:alkylhydroperoxidase/carboxymuconolactone decarboxylase family protein YurZ
MTKSFPDRDSKVREGMARMSRELPGPMAAFARLHKAASGPGALSPAMKELIALAIGITARSSAA